MAPENDSIDNKHDPIHCGSIEQVGAVTASGNCGHSSLVLDHAKANENKLNSNEERNEGCRQWSGRERGEEVPAEEKERTGEDVHNLAAKAISDDSDGYEKVDEAQPGNADGESDERGDKVLLVAAGKERFEPHNSDLT